MDQKTGFQKADVVLEHDSMLIYQPRFTDETRTRVQAIVRAPDGRIVEMEGDVKDGQNPFIRDVFAQYSVAEITSFSERERRVRELKERVNRESAEDRRVAEEREITFQAKTKALELEQVKLCPDPRVARRIRRAQSAIEVAGWVAVALMKSLEIEDQIGVMEA